MDRTIRSNDPQFDCSYLRLKRRLRFPQHVGAFRAGEFGQSASCGRAKQRMESIQSRVRSIRATVQRHGKRWKQRKTMQRSIRHQMSWQLQCGPCCNAKPSLKRGPQAVQTWAGRRNTMRDAGRFKLLYSRLAKGALRAEYREWQSIVLRPEGPARDPEHRQFAQQQSILPIRESNRQREIQLILLQGFNESAVTLNAQLDLRAWIKDCELPQDIRQQRRKILRSTNANGASQRRALHGLEQVIVQGQHAPGISQDDQSGLRQLQAPAVLAKQRCSQFLLQALHLQTDCGWCPSHTIRRLRKAASIMGCKEGPQRVEIEVPQEHPHRRVACQRSKGHCLLFRS